MQTIKQEHSNSAAYWGENDSWLIAYAINRDSHALERSNFRIMLRDLGGESDTVNISRSNHWACGWVEYITLDPSDLAKVKIARANLARIENYPVLNDEDYGQEEQDEAQEVWAKCYNVKDRIAYIRKFYDQFDFCGLDDAKACMRGEYFSGCSSELLN
jgi:hypothetical protein